MKRKHKFYNDRYPSIPPAPKIKCKSCGAPSQLYRCEYCGSDLGHEELLFDDDMQKIENEMNKLYQGRV